MDQNPRMLIKANRVRGNTRRKLLYSTLDVCFSFQNIMKYFVSLSYEDLFVIKSKTNIIKRVLKK